MRVHELIGQGQADQLVFGGKHQVTYGQLQQQVARYRAFFYHQGVRSGEHVGLYALNSPEFIYSYMAIVSLRAVVVPLNVQLVAKEIAYIIQDAKIKVLVTMKPFDMMKQLTDYGYAQQVKQLVIPAFAMHLPEVDGTTPLPEVADENEICAIIYTSGTTGTPKGAMLSHKNLVSNVQSVTQKLPVCAQDVVLCVLPMFHGFSWTCAVLGSLMHGATIVIADTFSREIVATIRDHQVTIVYGVPAMYKMLLHWGEASDFRGVHLFISGGASLPEAVAHQFNQKHGQPVIEGYGLSEASPVVCLNPLEKMKTGSIGKSLPGISIRIVDTDGNDVPIGECGELLVFGPNVMREYYNMPVETARAIRKGWLHTGDLAVQDDEGYVYIKDRLKDLIITSGENIYPREVEETLYAHPSIADAAVIGIADRVRGQAACAIIVPKEGHALTGKCLREFLRPQLAPYKIPKVFATIDALPKNSLGKVLKKTLQQQTDAIIAKGKIG